MTDEAEFLLATLRDTGTAPPESIDWQYLLLLAESHGVLPIFCRSYVGKLPEAYLESFRRQWTSSVFLAGELEGLLKEFDRHGVDSLPLKGPVLAESLYGSMSLRASDDLDLLVRGRDFARAQSLLMSLGYVPIEDDGNYHRSFERQGTLVELHSSVGPPSSPRFDCDGAWARSVRISFRGQPTRAFAQSDLMLYLMLHGVKHRFARLIWVADVARVLESIDDQCFLNVHKMACSTGTEGALLTTCALARRSFKIALPPLAVVAIASKPAIEVQAKALCDDILTGPAIPETVDGGAGVFIQLEPDLHHRWAQRLRFFAPSQQDYLSARRHGLPVFTVRLLRPFRLLYKHGLTAAISKLFPPVH